MYAAAAAIVISEIMYNPASSERAPVQSEWVEIYNTGKRAVDLDGWRLADEDGRTGAIGGNTTLEAGKAMVLIPAAQTVADFRAAWGRGFAVVRLKHWGRGGIHGLANNPSKTNEVLTLRRANGSVVDEVNYDDRSPWPSDRPDGPSIVLAADKLSAKANDKGRNWRRSVAGQGGAHHAKATKDYSAKDVGSPGYVTGPPLRPRVRR